MDDNRDLLVQADKLMRRHRVFLAGAAAPAAAPAEAVDDLPVLTEIVCPADEQPIQLATTGTTAAIDPEQIEARAQELLLERLPQQREALAAELAAWVGAELPQVVMRALDGMTDQLIAQVTAEARNVLLPRLQAALEEEPPSGSHGG